MLNKDQNLLEKLNLNDDCDEVNSIQSSVETAVTKFSQITNCTNATFKHVHRLWKSGSNLHNDVLSVLAAVTDVIKNGGGQETEVEYFSVLITSFANDKQSTNTLAATAYLLSLVIRKIPTAILVSRFSQVSQIFYVRLVQCAESIVDDDDNNEFNALLRYILVNLGVLLKVQPRTAWESPSTTSMFDGLLTFIVDRRPKLRRTAQNCVEDVLTNESGIHPASKICSKFIIETVERCGGDGKNVNSTLHVLKLLQNCLHRFGASSFKLTVETLLKLMTLSSNLVVTSTMQTLYAMFLRRPDAASMTDETNGQIIMALYDFEPPKNDLKARIGWSRAIVEGHVCLTGKNPKMCATSFFARVLQTFVDALSTTNQSDVVSVTVACIKRLLGECLKEFYKFDDVVDEKISSKFTAVMQTMLSYQYLSIWPKCFDLLSSYFDACRSSSTRLNVKHLLQSMAELRESENFPHKAQLDKTFGAAIRYLGPEIVLDAVPLMINADAPTMSVDFSNSWLLPLLRQNVCMAKLGHFASIFLPLAVKLKKRVDQFVSDEKSIESNVFDVVHRQIWDLLPSYCNQPTDVVETFKDLAKIFGTVLLERPSLRHVVLSSLRSLILKSSSNDENQRELARFAKNFLPILINLYVSEHTNVGNIKGYDEKGVRLASLETIRVYLKIAPIELIEQYLNVALEKLNDDATPELKRRVMDVLIALVKYLNFMQISKLFNRVATYCNQGDVDHSLQKKTYRIFEEISSSDTSSTKEFIENDGVSLTDLLVNDFNLVTSSTKSSRLNCLTRLIENSRCESADLNLMKTVLPDAVMCLKETNVKTRRSAAKLLIAIANSVSSRMKNIDEASSFVWNQLERFFDGKIQEICCVLIAARLYTFEFKNDVSSTMISTFLSHVCRLMKDERRPVVLTCLEFLKTFVSCSPIVVVQQYLDVFLPSLFGQSVDCRHHFRYLTRKILAKLTKKFSYETICKFTNNDNEKKQLNYIRKMLQRREKHKKLAENGQQKKTTIDDDASVITGLSRPETIADLLRDTDDEDEAEAEIDYDDDTRSRKSRALSKSSVFIQENDDDDDDEILDLLDRKMASKIVTKDVLKKKNRPKKPDIEFKTDKNGKLIIVDDEKNVEKEVVDVDKLLEPLGKRRRSDSVATSSEMKQKRKKRDSKDDDGDSDVDAALEYKPGGKGIHRPLTGQDIGSKFKSTKAKGDMKKKGQKVDPYAYIPFDYSALNKRKRAKNAGTYKNLIQGARKGATKGSKGRRNGSKSEKMKV